MSEEKQKLVIDRNVWLRGDPRSYLLRYDGKRCCIGIYLGACGVPDEKLKNQADVTSLVTSHGSAALPPEARWMWEDFEGEQTDVPGSEYIYGINDMRPMAEREDSKHYVVSEADRERKVREFFARHGVEVEFIN